jgi:phospholipid/cholesterol/gamma-HCH transport system substrate-binding protein
MQKKETAIEVKVGLVVLVALIALGAFILVIGDCNLGGKGEKIYIDFESAAGLNPSAPVRLSGIDAGTVRKVEYKGGEVSEELGRPVFVRVTADIKPEFMDELTSDTEFTITTQGVLGEPYVEAFTPVSDAPNLESGDIVRGDDPPTLSNMLASAEDTLNGIRELVDRLNEQGAGSDIRIDDFINNIGDLAGNLNEVIEDNRGEIDSMIEDVAGILDENRDKISRTMDNVEGASAEFEQVGASLSYSLGRGQTLKNTLTNVEEITEVAARDIDPVMTNVRELTGNANALISDNRDSIDNTIANLESTTTNVDDVVEKIASGEGTVGRLLQDEEIFEDVREFIRELKRRPWRVIWKE